MKIKPRRSSGSRLCSRTLGMKIVASSSPSTADPSRPDGRLSDPVFLDALVQKLRCCPNAQPHGDDGVGLRQRPGPGGHRREPPNHQQPRGELLSRRPHQDLPGDRHRGGRRRAAHGHRGGSHHTSRRTAWAGCCTGRWTEARHAAHSRSRPRQPRAEGGVARRWANARRSPAGRRCAAATGSPEESLRAALATLRAEHPWQVDQVVVAMPGTSVATHALPLPFKDAKRLEAALPFEVESQLPAELEEVVFDYQPGTRTEEGTRAAGGHRCARTSSARCSQLLVESGYEPRVVTHPALVYRSLFVGRPEALGVEGGSLTALVDVGHLRTTLAIGHPGRGTESTRASCPAAAGTSPLRSSANSASLRWMPSGGRSRTARSCPAGGPEHARAREAIRRALQPLLREVRATLKAATTRDRRPVGQTPPLWGHLAAGRPGERWGGELDLRVKPLAAGGHAELAPEQRARGSPGLGAGAVRRQPGRPLQLPPRGPGLLRAARLVARTASAAGRLRRGAGGAAGDLWRGAQRAARSPGSRRWTRSCAS